VTLQGVIDRHGHVKQLRVVDRKYSATAIDISLGRAALQNLNTWRFTPAHEPTVIKIAYEFLITHEAVSGFPGNIQFDLPRSLTIKAEASLRK